MENSNPEKQGILGHIITFLMLAVPVYLIFKFVFWLLSQAAMNGYIGE